MSPRVTLEIGGNSRGGVRAATETVDAIQKIRRETKEAARADVTAAIQKQEHLKAQVASYREVAAAAKRGSREQVAAAQLARKAEKELAGSIGVTAREQVALERSTARAEKTLGRGVRGAVAGSGAFQHLGRSVAFASTTFLGAAGFVHVVEESVKKAIALQAAVGETAVVFRDNHRDVVTWSKGLANGFGLAGGEALEMANDVGMMLKGIDIAPGKTAAMSKSIVELAADVGALRKTDPAGFVAAFDQALAGRTRGLKSYGVFIDDTRIKAQALSMGLVNAAVDTGKLQDAQTKIAIAQARLAKAEHDYGASSTQAATARLELTSAERSLEKVIAGKIPTLTAAQRAEAVYALTIKQTGDAHGYFAAHADRADLATKRLHAAVTTIEEEIGTALLPTVSKAASAIANWLSKTENQEKITKAVTGILHTFTGAVDDLWPIVKTAAHVTGELVDSVGGLKHAVELLLALKLYSWLSTATGGFTVLRGTKTAGIAGAEAEAGLLLGRLNSLMRLGSIAIPIILAISSQVKDKNAAAALDTGLLGGIGVRAALGTPAGLAAGAVMASSGSAANVPPIPSALAILSQFDPARLPPNLRKRFQAYVDVLIGKFGGGNEPMGRWIQSHPEAGRMLEAWLERYAAAYLRRQGLLTPKPVQSAQAGREGPGATHGGRQIPENIASGGQGKTHDTSGLAGYPAVDIMLTPGTPVLAPEPGTLSDPHFIPWNIPKRIGGWTCYFRGDRTGSTYFITHLATVGNAGHYHEGEQIGTVAAVPGGAWSPHVHVGQHAAPTKLPTGPTTGSGAGGASSAGGGAGALTVGTKPPKPKAPPLVSVAITEAVTKAKADVAKARTQEDQYDALGRELAALFALQGALEKADASATGKRKQQIETALLHVANDIKSVRAGIKRINRSAEKSLHAGVVHEGLVRQVANILGANDPQAYAALEGKTTAQLKAMVRRLRSTLRQVAAEVRAAAKKEKPLESLPAEMSIEITDELGRVVGHKTIGAIRAMYDKLVQAVRDAKTPAQKKRAADALKAFVDGAVSDAATAVQAASSKFETAFGRLGDRIMGAFDRETQRGLEGMQAGLDGAIKGLNADADRELRGLQERLAGSLKALELRRAALTPEEQAYQDFQGAHDAAQAAQDLADAQAALAEAQASTDASTPEGQQAIREAQKRLDDLLYQAQLADLQRKADASRKARDDDLDAQEEALRKTEADQEDSLQTQLATQIDYLTQAEHDREQAYQDARDAQRQALADQLADWQQHLEDGTASWSDFVKWLQGLGASGAVSAADIPDPVAAMANAGQLQGQSFADAYIAELERAYDALEALSDGSDPAAAAANAKPKVIPHPVGGGDHPGGGPQGFALGGRVPGQYVGRQDTVMARVTQGEEVIDRSLSSALRAELFGSRRRASPGPSGPIYVLGTTDREVERALARMTKPEQDRIVSYPSPL